MPKPPASRQNNRDMEMTSIIMQPYAPVGIIGLGLRGTVLPGRLIDTKLPSIEAISRRPVASEVIR
jgi:hypothetical protein